MKSGKSYHSALREERAAATRARILAACAAVMETGADLTYSAVASQALVQERTVYRHFPTKADLEAGLWRWILDNLTRVDFTAGSEEELVTNVGRSFAGFDAGAPLIQAMLHSRQGLEVRLRQQPERRAMFEACARAAVPKVSDRTIESVAAALQVLYSAQSWELLRTFWGMDGPRAADTVGLAIHALLAGARAQMDPAVSDRSPPLPTEATGGSDAAGGA